MTLLVYLFVGLFTLQSHANSLEKIVSCYYKFQDPPIEAVDLGLCTHILLIGEATIDAAGNFVPPKEDTTMEFLQLKADNKQLKLMLSIIAPNRHYSAAVSSPSTITRFALSTYQYLSDYRLDGIDLDWEFPSWNHDTKKSDRARLNNLLKAIREQYGSKFLLTMATSGPPTITRKAYDIPMLNKYCDFIQVMNYDFHVFSYFNPVTGFNAPLKRMNREYGLLAQMNSEASMWVYGALGLWKNKTVFGIPTYNYAFNLVNYYANWPYAPATSAINGFGGYPQVCQLTNGSSVYREYWNENAASSYITGTNKVWITNENEKSVGLKAAYAREIGCLGVMVFHIGTDDVHGECGNGKFPLINSIRKSFIG